MPLKTLDEAEDEFLETLRYYASQDWRTGHRFRRAYDTAIARIAADPTSLPWHHEAASDETRFKRIDGFPYLVLFTTVNPGGVVVLAVLHESAGPSRLSAAERRT
ncbi:type II toxin-antitoxin system RelE/ParE family toxin [Alienimonas chondri]|uniref:Type II toxin-antitoxin system RelE/ParE family toxin n=1 Tax=Alienimonas chondri TaxID=2681879 RepID=A0ABX1VAF6_9PLAN|nr:type II toxin-antitoxin system RelE/ParE family toxin [Alienimonas chondri]NNJ25048.1 hypothetical protein [Alienimonas chondri]